MSIHRYDARPDKAQPAIVAAIRDEGWDVYLIRLPCDVMCWHPILDRWQTLEIKTPERNGKHYEREKDAKQREFCERTNTPIVWTSEMALQALSRHYPQPGKSDPALVSQALAWRAEYDASKAA
jgi:hypothetical protein